MDDELAALKARLRKVETQLEIVQRRMWALKDEFYTHAHPDPPGADYSDEERS